MSYNAFLRRALTRVVGIRSAALKQAQLEQNRASGTEVGQQVGKSEQRELEGRSKRKEGLHEDDFFQQSRKQNEKSER